MTGRVAALIRQISFTPIANVKQVAPHRDLIALLTRPQQLGHLHAEALAEQVEQRRFQRRHRIDPQLKRPGAVAEGIEIRRLVTFVHLLHQPVHARHLLPFHLRYCRDQRLINGFTARRFADAGVTGAVGQHHDIAGEAGAVRAADVEQHAVVTRHRDHLHVGNYRGTLRIHIRFLMNGV